MADMAEGPRILWETGAAETGTRMQKLTPDPPIQTDASGNVMDVGAHLFAEICHLIDEGNLRRKEGVGGILRQLRGFQRREDNGRLDEEQRAIDRAHDRAGALGLGANHDTVRAHEITDCRALAKKLGVRHGIELGFGVLAANDLRELAAGPNRDRRFCHDDRIVVEVMSYLFGGTEKRRKIRASVTRIRGGSDSDENRFRAANGLPQVLRELKPTRRAVDGHDTVQTGFVNRDLALKQA